mgnify:FL=1
MYDPLRRFIRQKDAPVFFGVGLGKFNADIRPHLREIPMGKNPQSGIVYDIFDLHALADTMKLRNGRPAKKGKDKWDVKQKPPVLKSSNDRDLPTCISKAQSTGEELDLVLEQMMKR